MAERRKRKRVPFDSTAGLRTASDAGKAGAGRPSRPPRDWGGTLRGMARLFGPPVASALLLTLAFPPAEVSWLAYVALVPLLVTVARARTTGDAFWAATVGGAVFFGLNLYWFQPITTAGYAALIPYVALYWGALAWLARRPVLARVPMAIRAPVIWVALEYFRGWCISGLPWIYVGHTQYENLVLIQTADLVGAYGPSFLCLMTSGLVADFLVRPLVQPAAPSPTAGAAPAAPAPAGPTQPRFSRTILVMVGVTAAAWAFTIGYGLWRLGQATLRPGPVVASVQTCVPQEVKLKARLEQIEQLEEQLMREQLDLTDASVADARQAGLKIDLVAWPETMVPGIMNRAFLEDDLDARLKDEGMREVFKYLQRRSQAYWSRVQEKSRDIGAPVLFGAHAVEIESAYRLPGGGYLTRGPRYNTAFLLSPESKPYAADHSYAKAHLVPFGEYVPFKESWPWLHDLLRGFTPYNYDYSLTPGAHDQAPFVLKYGDEEARFQVAICYEDAMAYRVREMAVHGFPKLDFVVNISNDGWFVRGWLADNGSYELDQHLNLCVFRAVENRVAIVRSVNTGISALISPTGRIEQVVTDASGGRRNIPGRIVGRLTLDARRAPYTDIGDLFARVCLIATLSLVLPTVLGLLRRRKEAAT